MSEHMRWLALLTLFGLVGCASDYVPSAPAPVPEVESEQRPVYEPATFVEGAPAYGLPRDGNASIADLISLLPEGTIEFGDPNLFTSQRSTLSCDNGRLAVLPELPLTIEAVVTLHPRSYVKVPVCDQDERSYGAYTVEDDTGGILVLRDSRIAPFTFGDRVRLVVDAMTLTWVEPSSRAVLTAAVEKIDDLSQQGDQTVFYSKPVGDDGRPRSFDPNRDVGEVRGVEGVVVQPASNQNFGSLVVASAVPGVGTDMAPADGVCAAQCTGQCAANECPSRACRDTICPALCAGVDREFLPETLPVCWQVALDPEMLRRGYTYEDGQKVRAIGPVVDNYDVKILVQRLGQIEIFDED